MASIALPEMRRYGYSGALSTGALAAGGTLGILIPPSIILVIYAAIADQSVPRLFAAGLLPGLVLTALYMLVVVVVSHVRKDYAPAGGSATMRERLIAMRGPWQFQPHFQPTWTTGRLEGSGSAWRRISRVVGAMSPSPKKMKRARYCSGLPSTQPK